MRAVVVASNGECERSREDSEMCAVALSRAVLFAHTRANTHTHTHTHTRLAALICAAAFMTGSGRMRVHDRFVSIVQPALDEAANGIGAAHPEV
jgi:hypothetical protein